MSIARRTQVERAVAYATGDEELCQKFARGTAAVGTPAGAVGITGVIGLLIAGLVGLGSPVPADVVVGTIVEADAGIDEFGGLTPTTGCVASLTRMPLSRREADAVDEPLCPVAAAGGVDTADDCAKPAGATGHDVEAVADWPGGGTVLEVRGTAVPVAADG